MFNHRVIDLPSHKGRTLSRQTYGAKINETPTEYDMPQAGYITEQRHDFVFKDATNRCWYRVDPERYERISRLLQLRANLDGHTGEHVFCVRPIKLDERVPFPEEGDEIGNGYKVQYLEPSNTRVSFGIITR